MRYGVGDRKPIVEWQLVGNGAMPSKAPLKAVNIKSGTDD